MSWQFASWYHRYGPGQGWIIKAWTINHTHVKHWDVIAHPRPNFNGCFGKTFKFKFPASPLNYQHDDVIKWKHFPRFLPFMRGMHRSVNSPHKGQWRGALMFSLICAWINGWVHNREAGDLRCHRAHYDVTVINHSFSQTSGYHIVSERWTSKSLGSIDISLLYFTYSGHMTRLFLILFSHPDDSIVDRLRC